jgi:hypothetical protein
MRFAAKVLAKPSASALSSSTRRQADGWISNRRGVV